MDVQSKNKVILTSILELLREMKYGRMCPESNKTKLLCEKIYHFALINNWKFNLDLNSDVVHEIRQLLSDKKIKFRLCLGVSRMSGYMSFEEQVQFDFAVHCCEIATGLNFLKDFGYTLPESSFDMVLLDNIQRIENKKNTRNGVPNLTNLNLNEHWWWAELLGIPIPNEKICDCGYVH